MEGRSMVRASDVLMGGVGQHAPPSIFSIMKESWSKIGHAAREMVTVFSITYFFQQQ